MTDDPCVLGMAWGLVHDKRISRWALLYKLKVSTSMESVETIQKQIEYYMSDKNLENDEFFHTKISEAKEVLSKQMQGYLEIDILLNCNKIKKLGVKSSEDLLKAIEKSQELEVHPSKKLFRRKPDLKLPELKTKKVKPNNAGENVAAEKNPNDNPYKSLETYSSV